MKLKTFLPVTAGFTCALVFAAVHAAPNTASHQGHFGAPKLSVTANSANGDNFDIVNHDRNASHSVQIDGWSGSVAPYTGPDMPDPPSCTYCQYSTNIGYWPTTVTIDGGSQTVYQQGPITYVDIYPNHNTTASNGSNAAKNAVRVVVH